MTERVEGLLRALREIAALSDDPDDWEPYDQFGDMVDTDMGNNGDVRDFGARLGRWGAAKIARAALAEPLPEPASDGGIHLTKRSEVGRLRYWLSRIATTSADAQYLQTLALMALDDCEPHAHVPVKRALSQGAATEPASAERCPKCGAVAHAKCDQCGEEWFNRTQSLAHSEQTRARSLSQGAPERENK